MEQHHVAMKANHPDTLPTPINDHRAELTTAQQDWPKATRENPERSPALAAAAWIRGAADYIVYLVKTFLLRAADFLETLDAWLTKQIGSQYWLNSPLAPFAPKP